MIHYTSQLFWSSLRALYIRTYFIGSSPQGFSESIGTLSNVDGNGSKNFTQK